MTHTHGETYPDPTEPHGFRHLKRTAERTDEANYQKLPHPYRPIAGRAQCDPLDFYSHPYDSMKNFAGFLNLQFDAPRTRHTCYRQLRLMLPGCVRSIAISLSRSGTRQNEDQL